jgi:hypothetical protein
MTSQIDIFLLVGGIVISLIGIVLVYKQGPLLGLPISLLGILSVIAAALVKIFLP